MFEKITMSFWKYNTFLLNNTYSLPTGPTVLISYITVMFYKTTSFKTLFFLLLKIRSFTVKSVFPSVHHQCKLHGENLYITLVNVVHSYNTNVSWLYLVVILEKTVGGVFYGGWESSTCYNFRKHMQIEKAPANQGNIFINLTAGAANAHNTTKLRNALQMLTTQLN